MKCNLIRKVDLFGKPYIFEERDTQKFSTILGTVSTLMIVITCIIIGFMFGKEIYERKNPSVMSSDDKAQVSRVNMTNFPIFFAFINGPTINQPQAVNHIKMEITLMELDEKITPTTHYYSGYKKCDVSEYSEFYQPYVQEIYNDMGSTYDLYCINRDELYVKNKYASADSCYVNVRFLLCNSEIEECGNKEEQEKLMKDAYVMVVYIDAYVDPGNYDNPKNYYKTTSPQKLGESLLQRNFFSVQRTKLVTHKGWLLEDIYEEEILNIRSVVKDVSTGYNGNLFWFTIDSPNIRTKIVRSYMKVQDVIAKIGGF